VNSDRRVVRRAAVVIGALMVMMSAACRKPAPIGTLDRVDVAVQIRPDGSLDVGEDFTTGPQTAGGVFTRTIAPREADNLQMLSVAVDGVFASGSSDRGVTVDAPGRRMTVRWPIPADGGSHTLSIRYRAFTALRIDEPRAFLSWPAIEANRGYDVTHGKLTLTLPPKAPFYRGTGIAQAGWTVERTTDGLVATRDAIPDREFVTMLAELDLNRDTMTEGQWQIDEDRQWNLLPAYACGALFMLVIGIGSLVMLNIQYPPLKRSADAAARAAIDPEYLVVARGLRVTALVGTIVAIACSAFVYFALPRLGPWIQLIPGGMILTAMLFVIAAPRWTR
jgi:hypothetical protein